MMMTMYRSLVHRGEVLVFLLATGSLWSKVLTMLTFSHFCYFIRLSQILCDFEIRRVEADIRICPPELIHRVTPRFKACLQEVRAKAGEKRQ